LLAYLKLSSRRFSRGRRLSDQQLDELSLYCWTLQRTNPTGLLWGRARELWGGSRRGAAPADATFRRRERRAKG
jgi:hypothetical protein